MNPLVDVDIKANLCYSNAAALSAVVAFVVIFIVSLVEQNIAIVVIALMALIVGVFVASRFHDKYVGDLREHCDGIGVSDQMAVMLAEHKNAHPDLDEDELRLLFEDALRKAVEYRR